MIAHARIERAAERLNHILQHPQIRSQQLHAGALWLAVDHVTSMDHKVRNREMLPALYCLNDPPHLFVRQRAVVRGVRGPLIDVGVGNLEETEERFLGKCRARPVLPHQRSDHR
jgi:hypothetical protein